MNIAIEIESRYASNPISTVLKQVIDRFKIFVAVDKINMNELGIKKKFEEEVERYKKFKRMMFGIDKIEEKIQEEAEDIDFKTYAKYILKTGTILEKRELLLNLKSWMKLKNKQLVIEEGGTG